MGKKVAMVIVGVTMLIIMVGSSASLLEMGGENTVYDIILQELGSAESDSCYGKCTSDADCCHGVTTCLTYKHKPYCEWCPGDGGTCGTFDRCCPGFKCTGGVSSLFSGVCRPESWCPKTGETCNKGVKCCDGYECTGLIFGKCKKI